MFADAAARLPRVGSLPAARLVAEVRESLAWAWDERTILPPADASLFAYFHAKDQALYGSLTGESVCAQALDGVLLPLDGNGLSDGVVSEVVSAFGVTDVTEHAEVDTGAFDTFGTRAPEFYGNPLTVAGEGKRLWGGIGFPIGSNAVTARALSEITDVAEVFDVGVFAKRVQHPLECFELDDTQLYTRDTAVARQIEGILSEFDPDLPLTANSITCGIDWEIAAGLSLYPNPLTASARALRTIHPREGRVYLDDAPAVDGFFVDALPLPLSGNSAVPAITSDIAACLDVPDAPLAFFDFALTDMCPIQAFEAPSDIDADLKALADQLLAMILESDVAPFVPILVGVTGSEFADVLDGVVSGKFLADVTVHTVVPEFRVTRIATITGPVNDVPHLVTPDEVVGDLLRAFLLPEMPLRPVQFDELMSSAVDDLDLDSGGAPPPEDVKQMMHDFKNRARDFYDGPLDDEPLSDELLSDG
jgi:hypothetical protein